MGVADTAAPAARSLALRMRVVAGLLVGNTQSPPVAAWAAWAAGWNPLLVPRDRSAQFSWGLCWLKNFQSSHFLQIRKPLFSPQSSVCHRTKTVPRCPASPCISLPTAYSTPATLASPNMPGPASGPLHLLFPRTHVAPLVSSGFIQILLIQGGGPCLASPLIC